METTTHTPEEPDGNILCTACERSTSPDDVVTVNEQEYCRDCTFFCEWCCETRDGEPSFDIDRQAVCTECFDDSATNCDRCGEFDHIESAVWNYADNGDYRYCNDCLGILLDRDRLHWCETANEYQSGCMDDCNWCANDEDDDDEGGMRVVRAYEYRPSNWFFHDSREHPSLDPLTTDAFYMGLEVEMQHRNSSPQEAVDFWYDNVPEEVGFLKYDGSIGYGGFEVVTHPMTLDWARTSNLANVFDGLKDRGMRAWNKSACGLHISVSRSAFRGDSHQSKFMMLVFRNRPSLVQLVGRESEQYAAFVDRGSRPKPTKLVKQNTRANRYLAVNVNNPERLEVRMFRPSMMFSTNLAMMEFCEAAFEYTRWMSCKDIDTKMRFTEFRKWVEDNPRYELLATRIAQRVIVNSDEHYEDDTF